jgi:hypothetical protein
MPRPKSEEIIPQEEGVAPQKEEIVLQEEETLFGEVAPQMPTTPSRLYDFHCRMLREFVESCPPNSNRDRVIVPSAQFAISNPTPWESLPQAVRDKFIAEAAQI